MATRIPIKKRLMIPGSWLVRALGERGDVYECRNCGDRMFVQYASELCPLCFNGRRAYNLVDAVHQVPDGGALVGVLDDPALEE